MVLPSFAPHGRRIAAGGRLFSGALPRFCAPVDDEDADEDRAEIDRLANDPADREMKDIVGEPHRRNDQRNAPDLFRRGHGKGDPLAQ